MPKNASKKRKTTEKKSPNKMRPNKKSANPFTALVTLPEEAQNIRTRTDFSAEKSSLAKPFFKTQFTFNFLDQDGQPVDRSTSIPAQLFFLQYGRGPYDVIRWWQSVDADSYDENDTLQSSVLDATRCYQMVFYSNEEQENVTELQVPIEPEFDQQIKFKGLVATNLIFSGPSAPVPAAEAVYDSFQYSKDFKGKRYFYWDSGIRYADDDTYEAILAFQFSEPPSTGNTFWIRVFRWGQGADIIEINDQFVGDGTTIRFATSLPGEQHDFYRIEYGLTPANATDEAFVGFPAGTTLQVWLVGWGSALNTRNISGYTDNEKFVEKIKHTAHSCLLSNDQTDVFKNGSVYAAQVNSDDSWPYWVQLASGSLTNFIAELQDEDSSKAFNAARGLYSYLKPTSTKELEFQSTFVTSEGSSAGGGAHVHVDEWSDLEHISSFVQIAFVVNNNAFVPAARNLTLRARFFQPLEYHTDNQWVDKGTQDVGISTLNQSLEELRLAPQFFSNDEHLKQLAGFLKKVGLVATIAGAAITPISGPVGAGIAAAGASSFGAGELIDIIDF